MRPAIRLSGKLGPNFWYGLDQFTIPPIMSLIPSLQEASQVLAQFPGASGCAKMIPQGNLGGFTGAGLWRVASDACNLRLRAWPAAGMTTERLTEIHHVIAKAREPGL